MYSWTLLRCTALTGWERGHVVPLNELEAAERREGAGVLSGDALIIHMGNVAAMPGDGPDGHGLSAHQAGLHESCLPFLRERDVAVPGDDGVQDVQPARFGRDLLRPSHTVALVALGPG
ncbi:hypothetical protein ACFCWG_22240 [Streptomyces sp. NPDC056390]|uniref:hypothetical protein n=1 Tax=Streptomyces sp. NPDC056390 TaxID=3345806 RepID=UPI0035D5CDBA